MSKIKEIHAADVPDTLEALPPVKGQPQGCTWGFWDRDGERDQCGTLNMLTNKNAIAARDELKTGISVAVNWNQFHTLEPGFNRKPLNQKIISWRETMGYWVNDDELHFNTQASSQWDGFKHWGHQKSGIYYNNLSHEECSSTTQNGIHYWSKRGGLVARGVLIDYYAYAQRNGINYDPWTSHEITIQDLETILKETNTELKPADILIIRSGWVDRYNNATKEQRIAGVQEGHDHVGVKGCEETVRWLWKHKFAGIAGDTIAWESWPPKNEDWIVHDWSLAMAGRPIGELWDLERLSKVCEEQKRWSFFFTSAPLNVEGGVASPPNALAIF